MEDVTLVAVWDVGDPEVAARAARWQTSCRSTRTAWSCSGGDEVSLGLRIWRQSGEASLECAVEPMHAEPSKVYIRLVQTSADDAGRGVAALREASRRRARASCSGRWPSFILARARR